MNDPQLAAAVGEPLRAEPVSVRVRAWLLGTAFRALHVLRGHRVYCWHHRTRLGGGWLEVNLQCVTCDRDVYLR